MDRILINSNENTRISSREYISFFVKLIDKSKYHNLTDTLFMLRRVKHMQQNIVGIAFFYSTFTDVFFINLTFLRLHRFSFDVFCIYFCLYRWP